MSGAQNHHLLTCNFKFQYSCVHELSSCNWYLLQNRGPSCCLICFQIWINWSSSRTHSFQNTNVRQRHFRKGCCCTPDSHTSVKPCSGVLKFQANITLHLTVLLIYVNSWGPSQDKKLGTVPAIRTLQSISGSWIGWVLTVSAMPSLTKLGVWFCFFF